MNDVQRLNDWLNYYNPKFKSIFNFDMPHDIHGIDIFKLGDIIGVPNAIGIREFVLEQYGMVAYNLVSEILNTNPTKFKKEN